MDLQTIEEIKACLPQGKTTFHYFKDRYALMLLKMHIGGQCKISDLKRTAWGRLLNKPLLRELCAGSGDGYLTSEDFDYVWKEPSRPFLLSLSQWGGRSPYWQQTCRKGYNLVLQLNFSNQHTIPFHRMVKEQDRCYLRSYSHPVMHPGDRELFRETLAWARIDLDFDSNEALVEEIQNDWLRNAEWWLSVECEKPVNNTIGQPIVTAAERYLKSVLAPYRTMWDEALLAACIEFIVKELGIATIYYHEHQSGAWLKAIKQRLPPRSLYSDLPKKFCFERTERDPVFLRNDRYFQKRKRKYKKDINWFVMNLNLGDKHVSP